MGVGETGSEEVIFAAPVCWFWEGGCYTAAVDTAVDAAVDTVDCGSDCEHDVVGSEDTILTV